ncbi:MAG: hypothetical protein ACFE0O_04230 [Opitutales bacterium]
MTLARTARPTLTPVELDEGESLAFTLVNGETRTLTCKRTGAHVHATTLEELKVEEPGARTIIGFFVDLEIDGYPVSLKRMVGDDASFYQPYDLFGLRIWPDAVDALFEYMTETHGECRPRKAFRFAVQDASLRDCPVRLHPWCPLPAGGLRIADCYDSDDCWLGAYHGASAHGGLDINHLAGTVLTAPFAVDRHGWFNHLDRGDNNNRWRGEHRWPDGSTWILQSHHLIRLLVPADQPIEAGTPYAETAGVLIGGHEHTHFVFRVREADGIETLLDPWILFYWMYQDLDTATVRRLPSGRIP